MPTAVAANPIAAALVTALQNQATAHAAVQTANANIMALITAANAADQAVATAIVNVQTAAANGQI
jgi:hypothetical protein